MNLKEAVLAVAPALGDGKLIPLHAYIELRQTNETTSEWIVCATDGRIAAFAKVDAPAEGLIYNRFCVRGEPLAEALRSATSRISAINVDGTVHVRDGRSRVSLRSVTDRVPAEQAVAASGVLISHPIIPAVRNLLPWRGKPDVSDNQLWSTSIHVTREHMFAGGPHQMCRIDRPSLLDFEIPAWLADYLVKLDVEPLALASTGNTTTMYWEDGLKVQARRLGQQPPDTVHAFIGAMGQANAAVPEGLGEALKAAKKYDAKNVVLGNGTVEVKDEMWEMVHEVTHRWPLRRWNIEYLQNALQHATHIDLAGDTGVWHGNGMRGAIAGMRE